MKKIMKVLIGTAIVACLAALIAARMLAPKEELETRELPIVSTGKLERGSIETTVSLMGKVAPSDTYFVLPKAAGELREVYVKNGDIVKAGDKIAAIDNQKQIDAAAFSLEQASAQEKNAQDTANRMASLRQSGDISEQDYESARTAAEAASAAVKSARLNYDTQAEFSTVTAPASGTVQNSTMSRNALVSQSTQLCSIAASGGKIAKFNVTEDLLGKLSLGQSISLEKEGQSYSGKITEIGSAASPETGLFPVKATLENAELLPDGASCKISLVSERAEDAELIPLDAVYYSAGEPYVYLYQDGKAVRNPIELGIQNKDHAEVLSGLDENALVVLSWNNEIYDGAPVRLSGDTGESGSSASQSE